MYNYKVFLIIGCLLSAVVAHPQYNWDQERQTQQSQQESQWLQQLPSKHPGKPSTTTPAPANAATTASPRYLACLQNCPTTSEYNPVCGTDRISYYNKGRLNCASRCGKNVSMRGNGNCPTIINGK